MSNAVWSDLGVAGNNREVRATILQLEMQVGSLRYVARPISQFRVRGMYCAQATAENNSNSTYPQTVVSEFFVSVSSFNSETRITGLAAC